MSHLYALDTYEKMRDTWRFWLKALTDVYDIVISDVVIKEIAQCYEPKREFMTKCLKEIKHTLVIVNDDMEMIANEVIKRGLLKKKDYNDCVHIGTAVLCECDYLLSWNIEDLSNTKTVNGVRSITTLLGHKDIDIITPATLLELEEKC
jgi:predicted nucleic acid-binding protein